MAHSGESVLSRTKLKLSLPSSGPTDDVPSNLVELQNIAQELQRQKAELLSQLKAEDQDRHSYYTQLEHLARQMRELPLPTDSPTMEYELERRRLELETQRQQDLMMKNLGPASEVVRRREERILVLRKIDQKLADINNAIARQVEKESESSGDLCPNAPAHPEWMIDKEVWLSNSSLDFRLEADKQQGHSDTASVMSFTSSIHSNCITGSGSGGGLLPAGRNKTQLGPKVEVVYNLLTMLFSHDRHNVSQKLLHMSANPETRSTLYQVGCIPLLVQLIYNQDGGSDGLQDSATANWILSDADKETRSSAAQALHNLVYNHADDRKVKREIRILRLLELIRDYCDTLRDAILERAPAEVAKGQPLCPDDDMGRHPCAVVTNMMKLSFDDDHRQAMSHLGALQGLAELLHLDQLAHGSLCNEAQCTTLRRYASMTLTNLTFGHGPNKSLLCSVRPLLVVLAHQLASPNDDLRQVTASVLRNLSWRADSSSKEALQQASVVRALITVSMETHRESTLKSMLSALWNLSAHSSQNKADICATPGALEFLVKTLSYKSESKTLSVVESGGGILRNISSHVATREDYRAILRQHNCLQILLHQLRSPSLTVVSNACGTLWNLSARSKEDQKAMRDLGAIPMLRSLVHSRHKMIAMGSSAALKNLESAGFGSMSSSPSTVISTNVGTSTALFARKQKALEQEIDHTLTEMCDNIDAEINSPIEGPDAAGPSPFDRRMYRSLGGNNTTSQYRRSAVPSLLAKGGITPSRQIRSSSLERTNHNTPASDISSIGPSNGAVRSAASPAASAAPTRLQNTRTVWRSHDDEISYTTLNYEEDDQPVNYSLKYAEEVATVPGTRWASSARESSAEVQSSDPKSSQKNTDSALAATEKLDSSTVKKVMVYSAYTETDLDEPEQPTDFSLRYQEDEDYAPSGDTMKTYYIEGTPYETPFSCSSAASLTDLRETGLEGKIVEETADKEEYGNFDKETPENAADPGATGTEESKPIEQDKSPKTPPLPRRSAAKEGKTVTFNTEAENYAEQTPLMFSRCSSLESLGSIDQQQINDEGSVVSEFSRLTSRAVSPSELPDSPGQTMPPSPRRPQPPAQLHQRPPPQPSRAQQPQQTPQQKGIFEDATNAFGQEGTPAFTREASPLSQLSFEDETTEPVAEATVPRPPLPLPALPSIPTLSRHNPNPSAPAGQPQDPSAKVIHPGIGRVTKSASENNFRGVFFDETRAFNEEDSPSLTRCTSLSSLHIDGEVISTAKLSPLVQARGRRAAPTSGDTNRKIVEEVPSKTPSPNGKEKSPQVRPGEPIQSADLSEESEESDDGLLEDIITKGRPASRPPPHPSKHPQAAKVPSVPISKRPVVGIPKSASAHSLGRGNDLLPVGTEVGIPPSVSTDCALSALASGGATAITDTGFGVKGSATHESDSEGSVDDEEILYACIQSAMPKAKPLPPRSVSNNSVNTSSASAAVKYPSVPATNGAVRNRPSRPPMELPKNSHSLGGSQLHHKESQRPSHHQTHHPHHQLQHQHPVPHHHGSHGSSGSMAHFRPNPMQPLRAKSTEGIRLAGRRSRHSSQGSSRLGASGSSNNTSVDLDSRHCYKVEDTPVTFSRNSSLSSLSVDSNDDEPSAEDQALLDSCISSAMPKSKSDLNRASQAGGAETSSGWKFKPKTASSSKIPNSHSWSGVRRAGDGQASAGISLAASAPVTPSVADTQLTGPPAPVQETAIEGPEFGPAEEKSVDQTDAPVVVEPSDIHREGPLSLEGPESMPSLMSQSSLIRIEANKIAAQISQSIESVTHSISELEHVDSLASSLISGADSLTDNVPALQIPASPMANRKFDQRQSATKNRPSNGNVLLKQALSSNILTSTESLTSSSCLSSIDLIKPPASLESTAEMVSSKMETSSSLKLACSVLNESYFDDEQRREGLLQELALLEQTVDENANTDSVGSGGSSPSESGQKKKLTPRARRQADKDRYQTYTLNANEVEMAAIMDSDTDKCLDNGPVVTESNGQVETKENSTPPSGRTPRQRRSDDRERFLTQTISTNSNGHEEFTEKSETESVEKTLDRPSPAASISMSDPTDLSTLEMDAKVVIRTLAEQDKRGRKNSDSSELISEECLLDCETLSLVSNESESDRSLGLLVRKLSLQHVANLDNCENDEDPPAIPKSRIVRPDEKINDEANTVKAIRGRRRALCPVRIAPSNGPNRPTPVQISPSSSKAKNVVLSPASRTTQPRGRSASPASPSPVRPNRTSALRQTNTQKGKSPSAPALESSPNSLHIRLQSNSKSPRVSSAPCSPRQPEDTQSYKRRSLDVICKTGQRNEASKTSPAKGDSDPAPPSLASIGKQGTFTKDKSSTPESNSTLPSPATNQNVEERPSKVPPKVPPKPKLKPGEGPAPTKPAVPKKPTRFNGPSPLSSPRSKGSPALSRRSVSSASIGSDSTVITTCSGATDDAPTSAATKRTPPKKVVTSKIASLWKQVEESRSKQKNEPDTRKWISRGDNVKPVTHERGVGTSPGVASSDSFEDMASLETQSSSGRPLISSGTFEKLSSFANDAHLPVVGSSHPAERTSAPSRLPFRLPRFTRSGTSGSSNATTPTAETPELEEKRKFRVTAL